MLLITAVTDSHVRREYYAGGILFVLFKVYESNDQTYNSERIFMFHTNIVRICNITTEFAIFTLIHAYFCVFTFCSRVILENGSCRVFRTAVKGRHLPGSRFLEALKFALIFYIVNIIQTHIMLYVTYLFEWFSINIFLILVFIIYTA